MTQPSIGGFFSGGNKSFSWKEKPLGTTISGAITAIHPPQQATDPVDGSPQVSKRTGRPKMQVRISMSTNERDPQDPDDDGSRDLYVGGWMQGAVGDALRKAGAPNNEPQVGGILTVTLTERQPNDVPALAPINKFVAQYQLAPVTAGYFAGPEQQQAPQQQYAVPPQPVHAQQAPQYQFAVAAPGYAAPSPQYAQQAPVQQFPPAQQAQPQYAPGPPAPAGQAPALPAKPAAIAQGAWDAMPDEVKRSVAATFADQPPF